jgi:hypothetical protein
MNVRLSFPINDSVVSIPAGFCAPANDSSYVVDLISASAFILLGDRRTALDRREYFRADSVPVIGVGSQIDQ